MNPTHIPPETVVTAAEGVSSTPGALAEFSRSITGGSESALLATQTVGPVMPGIMSTVVQTGALAFGLLGVYLGAKTMITGKPPWKKTESL